MSRINTNVNSLIAQTTLSRTQDQLQTSLTRLSTGLRINSGKDDPAGLIASENLRRDITSANTAISNSQQAGQLIATADSSLGQISNLLNTIRGLAVQAANSGVLSDDQIAANQLQVDASLDAIDRIAKVTTFQGRKLLDGSLDFTKAYTSGGSSVADLSINSANLGTAGSLAVNVNISAGASQALITDTGLGGATVAQATGALALTGGNTLTLTAAVGGAADGVVGNTTDVKFQAAANIAQATGTSALTNSGAGGASIAITAKATGAKAGAAGNAVSVAYQADAGIAQATTGAVTLTNSSASITVAAKSGGAFDGVAGNAASVAYQADAGIAQSTGNFTLSNGAIALTATAGGAADGTAGDNLSIVIAQGAGATAVTNYNAGTNTLTINVAAGDTIQDIANAITTDGTFTVGTVTTPTNVYTNTDDNTYTALTTGGNDGTTTASITGNAITVNVGLGANGTLAQVKAAIDGLNGGNDFTTTVTNSGNTFDAGDFAAASTSLANGSDGATSASITGNAITVNVALNDTVTNVAAAIAGLNAGADFTATATNGSHNFASSDLSVTTNLATGSDGTNSASYDSTTNVLTVNVANGTTGSLANVQTAINADGTFVASNGTGASFNSADLHTLTDPLTGGQSQGLAADLVVRIGGDKGSEVFNFRQGATITQIVNAINLVTDGTGVQAANSSGTLNLTSTSYGSAGFIDVEALSEGAGGTFTSGLSGNRATGTDVVATVNGATASGKGNQLAVHTATLDLSLTVANGSSTAVSFNITGGGAVFQLGPNVVTNQQARIGIGSVSTGTLGGTDGRLYELRSGYGKDLASNPNGATLIVDEAINKVTSLRGRLGAFQSTTIDTNVAALKDTVTNLTEAQSQIRDADFAAETANLTRAQVLVQSGTQVLSIANQQPQNVLALLRNL
jgi:flagellin